MTAVLPAVPAPEVTNGVVDGRTFDEVLDGAPPAPGWHDGAWHRVTRMAHPNARLTPTQRFELKVDRSDPSGCHRWTGAHHGKGYGHFRYEGKVRKAHVVALLLDGVEVPDGMTVDHVKANGCAWKDCVRRDHLEVVTGSENTLRGDNPCAVNKRKGRCKRGHRFTADNTLGNGRGRNGRRCRTCHNEREAARRAGQEYP